MHGIPAGDQPQPFGRVPTRSLVRGVAERLTNESAGALFGLSAASGLHREGEPGLGDEELRLLVPAWPSGGREKFPGKANPGSAPISTAVTLGLRVTRRPP